MNKQETVDVHRADCGTVSVVFGMGTTVGELATALSGIPQDAVLTHLLARYFTHELDCTGTAVPDEDHHVFVGQLVARPADLPGNLTVPDSPQELT